MNVFCTRSSPLDAISPLMCALQKDFCLTKQFLKPHFPFRLKRPKDSNGLSGNLARRSPFRQNGELGQPNPELKKNGKANSSNGGNESKKSNQPCINKERSFTIFTTAVNENELRAIGANQTSLCTWKKQLKICIESNSSSTKSEPLAKSESAKRTNEKSLLMRRQQSWSSDSSLKCYKVLNYQNSTLASICVQGKDPPLKSRIHSANRIRSYSSSFPVSTEEPKKACDIEPPATSQLPDRRCLSSSAMETDVIDENTDEDEVFSQKPTFEDSLGMSEHTNLNKSSVSGSEEDTIPNLELINLNFGKVEEEEEESGNESDISEQEMSSDEEDGIADSLGDAESNRLCIERYKELYKNENISTASQHSFDADAANTTPVEDKKAIKKLASLEKTSSLEEPVKYQFASVFPQKFQKYNLNELSTLPFDLNWRNVVRLSDLHTERRGWSKKSYVARQRHARSPRVLEDRDRLESFVDRLLSMEKMQSATKQFEQMNRYHFAHVRAAAAKMKVQNNKSSPTPIPTNDEKPSDSPNESGPPTSRTSTRRRSSVPLASARLAWANEIAQGEQNMLKEAHRSGDFSALIDDWSAKNKPNRCYNDRGRRSSGCALAAKRTRNRFTHPRFYEYEWSERTKDDKSRAPLCWNSRLRSCSTCREKWRKINNMTSQERRRRPR